MAANCITIIFLATLFIGMECRSMIFSSLNKAVGGSKNSESSKEIFLSNLSESKDLEDVINLTNVNRRFADRIFKDFPAELSRLIAARGSSVENSLAELIARAVNVTDQEDTASQWLEQLKLILEAMTTGIQIEKSSISSSNDFGETEMTLHEGNKKFVFIDDSNWLANLRDFLDEQYISNDNESHVKSSFKDSSKDSSYSSADQSSEEIEDDGKSDRHDSDQLDDMAVKLQNDISGVRRYLGKLCRKHRTAL